MSTPLKSKTESLRYARRSDALRRERRGDAVLEKILAAEKQVKKEPGTFSKTEVAEHLANAARLCMESSSRGVISKARLRKRSFGLFHYLDEVSKKSGDNPEVTRFLSDAHGIAASLRRVSMYGQRDSYSPTDLKNLLFYNSLHWAGAAGSLGAEKPLERGTYEFSGGSIDVLEDGRVAVEGKSLGNIVRSTPHLFASELPKRIALSSTGKTTLSPGELFTVLRAASNAFHSTQLNYILYNLRQVSSNPGRILKSKVYLSNPGNLAEIIRKSASKYPSGSGALASQIIAGDSATQFLNQGALHPEHFPEVEKVLAAPGQLNRSEPALVVICHAAGLPLDDTVSVLHKYKASDEIMQKAMDSARKDARVEIRLAKDHVTVTDTGLGKPFEFLSKTRFGSGTSSFLQVGTKRTYNPNGTTSTVMNLGTTRAGRAVA